MFNWILNLAPALSLVVSWVQKLFSIRLVFFIAVKAIIFFLAYKYMPYFLGRAYQWLYNQGIAQNLGIDLPALVDGTVMQIAGLAAWLFYQFKIDVCLRIMISAAVVRLVIKPLPFIGH